MSLLQTFGAPAIYKATRRAHLDIFVECVDAWAWLSEARPHSRARRPAGESGSWVRLPFLPWIRLCTFGSPPEGLVPVPQTHRTGTMFVEARAKSIGTGLAETPLQTEPVIFPRARAFFCKAWGLMPSTAREGSCKR